MHIMHIRSHCQASAAVRLRSAARPTQPLHTLEVAPGARQLPRATRPRPAHEGKSLREFDRLHRKVDVQVRPMEAGGARQLDNSLLLKRLRGSASCSTSGYANNHHTRRRYRRSGRGLSAGRHQTLPGRWSGPAPVRGAAWTFRPGAGPAGAWCAAALRAGPRAAVHTRG